MTYGVKSFIECIFLKSRAFVIVNASIFIMRLFKRWNT